MEIKSWQASDPSWEDDFVIVKSKSKKQKQFRFSVPF